MNKTDRITQTQGWNFGIRHFQYFLYNCAKICLFSNISNILWLEKLAETLIEEEKNKHVVYNLYFMCFLVSLFQYNDNNVLI